MKISETSRSAVCLIRMRLRIALWSVVLGTLLAHALVGLTGVAAFGTRAHEAALVFGAVLGLLVPWIAGVRRGGAAVGLLLGGGAWLAGSFTHWLSRLEPSLAAARVCPGDCVPPDPLDSVAAGGLGLGPAFVLLVVCALTARSAPSRDYAEATTAPLAAATALVAAVTVAWPVGADVAPRLGALVIAVAALLTMVRIQRRDRALRTWLEAAHGGFGAYRVEDVTAVDAHVPHAVDDVEALSVIVAVAAHGTYRASCRRPIARTGVTAERSVAPLRSRSGWLLAAQAATLVMLAMGAFGGAGDDEVVPCTRECPL